MKDLVGGTIETVIGLVPGSDTVHFKMADGRRFQMFHSQDCCENVSVAEVVGDVADLVGGTVLLAEESTNSGDPPSEYASWTWTFYRIITDKGLVVIRWLGQSNGYYSESVCFEEVAS